MISQLNVQFDTNAIKIINEICKCDPLEGVSPTGDEFTHDDNKTNKYQQMMQ